MPRVKVRLVALLRDALNGRKELDLQVEPGATLGDVVRELCRRYPRLQKVIGDLASRGLNVLYVLNHREVGPETRVKDGDEIAILPPASGG